MTFFSEFASIIFFSSLATAVVFTLTGEGEGQLL